MKEADILRDIMYFRTESQLIYNKSIIETRNPEVRQLFTQLRDDETRAVSELQQRVERLETPPTIISKFIPGR